MAEYIKNAVKKKNMLTNWNVALIGNGSSGLMEKIGGKEVNLAFRKPKNTFTDDKAAYGVIWDPNHEALDIDKKKYQEANKEVYSENNEESNAGIEARFTKVLREKRSNKNGLLLIYPILPMDYKSVPRLGEDKDPIKDFNNSWKKFKEDFKLEKALST